jgi:hypothetical protein
VDHYSKGTDCNLSLKVRYFLINERVHSDGHQKGKEKEEDQKQHGGAPSKMK